MDIVADGSSTTAPVTGTLLSSSAPTPVSIVYVTSTGQSIQVQSVIQPNQSVIQSASGQTIQVIEAQQDSTSNTDESEATRKRREILARRPSYRKILNELSAADDHQAINISKIEEEEGGLSSQEESSQDGAAGEIVNMPIQAAGGITVVPASALQFASSTTAGGDAVQGLQTLTMTNANGAAAAAAAAATGQTIVHYAQSADGQVFQIPGLKAGATIQLAQGQDGQLIVPADLSGYQIRTSSSLPQGVLMAQSAIGSPSHAVEEQTRKRSLRLMKNREAARECRRKKKEYVKCLENRVAVLESQNKALIEELKSLKELYCQKSD